MPKGVYFRTDVARKNIGLATLGRKHSDETRRKIGIAHLGNKHNIGRRLPDSQKKKIAEALRGVHVGRVHSESARANMSKSHIGHRLSQETKRKLSENLRGEKAYNWKGKTELKNLIRGCFKYREWRMAVFVRDCFTCVMCGISKCYLEADHHPKMFSEIFWENRFETIEDALECEEMWDINNGRTLCKECHKQETYGRKQI